MNRPLTLESNRFAHLHGAACLQVTRGLLWLTIDGEPDDLLLRRGDRVDLPRGASALAQALDAPAHFVVRRSPGRIERALQALREALQHLRHAVAPQARLL